MGAIIADASSFTARICLTPRVHGVGGMVSFQAKLAAGLLARGIQVCYDLDDLPYHAVLVIGGTRQLAGLWRACKRGALIVQRLDGMNWLHRLPGAPAGKKVSIRHYLRAEYGNFILSTIRRRLAQRIVYQSEFSRQWWERVYGSTTLPYGVVYNGVDLSAYSPHGRRDLPQDRLRLLLVEGSLMGGYESGLKTAIGLAERLDRRHSGKPVELMIVGRAAAELQAQWTQQAKIAIIWVGQVPREAVPEIDRSAHLLYSSDVNAACPNSVIEALACGLPVVAFDTGALPELVTPEAGRVTAYGGDPWKLDPPDVAGLANAAVEVLDNLEHFRQGARARAEQAFELDTMVEHYLEALLG